MERNASASQTVLIDATDPRRLLQPFDPDLKAVESSDVIGEPRIRRALRELRVSRHADKVVFRVATTCSDDEGNELVRSIRRWCEATIQANEQIVVTTRRTGWKTLGTCLLLLASSMVFAAILENESFDITRGVIRRIMGEGVVIAGWVVMWRPIEMLLFDTLAQREENRLLRRLLGMEWALTR